MFKTVFTKDVAGVIRNPIGVENLQFRRTTSRYKRSGTWANNKGYLSVSRNASNGQFVKRA